MSGEEIQILALTLRTAALSTLLILPPAIGMAWLLDTIDYLVRVRDELPVPTIYVTHHMQEVEAICEEIVVLERGRVVEQRVI
jgi:ABC-type molybdate transport system ATPase subunit